MDLPNPEWRPAADWLDAAWLRDRSAAEGVLAALREARALLADEGSRHAHIETALAALARGDSPVAPGAVGGLCGVIEAASAERERAVIFLGAVGRAYALQAMVFGLHHRLDDSEALEGSIPDESWLTEVWSRVHLRAGWLAGARVPERVVEGLGQKDRIDRVDESTPAVIRDSLARGLSVLCARDQRAWLIAAATDDVFTAFDVLPGTSRRVEIDDADFLRIAR